MSNREIARVLREAADRVEVMDTYQAVHTVTVTLDIIAPRGVKTVIEGHLDVAGEPLESFEPVVLL